jgi:hypothetical protein
LEGRDKKDQKVKASPGKVSEILFQKQNVNKHGRSACLANGRLGSIPSTAKTKFFKESHRILEDNFPWFLPFCMPDQTVIGLPMLWIMPRT